MTTFLKMVEENLGEYEHVQRSIGEYVEVYIFEPKQGPILEEDDESDEEEGRLDECLTE